MTMLSETDWELINAYADGELPAGDEEAISRRLTHDTALAAALAEVHAAKASLSLMRPVKEPALPVRRGSEFRRLALAASVAAAVAFGALYQFGGLTEDWRDAPADLHAAFSGNTYVLPEGSALPVISTARIGDVQAFDLSSSRLALVDMQTVSRAGRDVVAMHYRGRNGCRLSAVALEAGAGDPDSLPARHDGLGARWTVGGIHFYLLASGMDRNRFSAIATYAEAETRRLNDQDEMRLAMRSATDQAQPCA
jgi:anti-sigma factor RsiW